MNQIEVFLLPMKPPKEKEEVSKNVPISQVYDQIAESFDTKRKHPWEDVTEFIDTITKENCTLDLGSGNGRHSRLLLEREIDTTSMDISYNILKTALKNELALVKGFLTGAVNGDVLSLPFKDNSFDRITMIAVFHHLDDEVKRKIALKEIARILKKQGQILLSCWMRTHPRFKKEDLREIIEQGEKDVLVPWKMPDGTQIMRYYYLFDKEEIEQLLENANLKIISSRESFHNLFIIAENQSI